MIFFLFLFFIFGGLSAASDASMQMQCLDTVDFSSTWIRKWTPCPQQVQLEKRTVTNVSSAFDITFQCYHAPNSVCEKAKRSFEKAAKMISDIVLFKEPVRVNATLMSFCQMGADCNNGMMTLGGSSPTRSIPLINTDGLSRLHPQALVKQFDLSEHPSYFPFDIISVFNADAPFWFEVIDCFYDLSFKKGIL